mmetsp:Transcript_10831/g.21563  ORF Transcript_10831/g.21563 Transcript_10831/m.21563 type:complete len:185 (+) Transcript_10831:3-557(+)
MPAYNISRLADLSWGNRPTISQVKAESRRKSLDMSDDAARLEIWLAEQMAGCKRLNFALVVANLIIMVVLEHILKSTAFLPEIKSTRVTPGIYDGALEVCVIFSTPWVLLLIIGTLFHSIRHLLLREQRYIDQEYTDKPGTGRGGLRLSDVGVPPPPRSPNSTAKVKNTYTGEKVRLTTTPDLV